MTLDISAKLDYSISPSAYVAFASMEAENACGIQGSIIDMTTVAFGQSELSTYAYSPFGEPIRQLNFSDFNGCNPSGEYNSALPYRCQPDLAFESMGYTFQPAWSTCIFRDAPPDPPFALIPGSDLGTIPTAVISVSTPAIAHPITSIPALPINTQTLDTPMPTSQPQTTAGLPQEPDPSSIAIGSISSDSPGVQSVPQQNTIASQLYTADSLSQYTTKGQTDAPKATITTQRSSVSILQATSIALTSATVVFGGQTYTAEVVSALSTIGQPYTPAVVIIMSGTPTTIALPSIIDPHSTPGVLTISAQSYSPDPASNLEHSSQTSPTNTIITFSGTPLTVIVPTLASTGPEVFTFAGSTYTANSASNFIVGSQTLVPGSVITMSGSPITFEVGVSETDVVIGTSTQNLGALIIGPFATPTNSSMVNIGANGPFASSAKRLVIGIDRLIFLTLLLTMGWGGRGFV